MTPLIVALIVVAVIARVVLEARVLTIQEQTGITATVEVRRGTVPPLAESTG